MMDCERFRWSCHDSMLACSSAMSPLYSTEGTSGFFLTRFRSSCRLSMTMLRNSWESYCSRLANYFLKREMTALKFDGTTSGLSERHIYRRTLA